MTQLRDRMLEELERRNYAPGTARAYLFAVKQFAEHFHRAPDQLGAEHIREYQLYLFRERKLAAKTVSQRVAALRFFFVKTLKRHHHASARLLHQLRTPATALRATPNTALPVPAAAKCAGTRPQTPTPRLHQRSRLIEIP